jgi:hypothetical protein
LKVRCGAAPVPVETDWVNLTPAAVSIGDHFGTTASAWTLTDAFTVPDVISASFKLRAVDGTPARAAALLAKSAATTNTVTVRGALTVTTPAAAWVVGAPVTVNWTAKGSLGNIIIEYQSSTDNNLDPWSTFSTVTASTASGGSGTTAAAGSYAWSSVADVVSAEVGAGSVQSDPDVFMRVKVTDLDDATVTATSAAFTARYRVITWRVLDPNGNAVTALNVSEASTTNPVKAAFNVTDNTFSGNSTVRYYPDNAGLGEDLYTTLFERAEGGTVYSTSSSGWAADTDKTITLTMDTAATAAINYTAEINAVYSASDDAIAVSSWLTKKGVQVSGLTAANSSISANIYDTAGVQLNTSDLGAGATPNAQGIYSGIVYDPAGGLDPSQTYTIRVTITYNSAQYTGVSGFVSPSVFTYTARIGAIYNNANDSVAANIWLERSGTTVTDPGDMTFKVFGGSSAVPLNGAGGQIFDGYDTTVDTAADAALINGVYTGIEYNPTGAMDSNIIYTIKADIVYRGRTYNAVASFSKGELGAIQSDIAGINTGIAAQTTTLTNTITGQTSTIQSSLTGTQAALTSTITSQVGTVQTGLTGLRTDTLSGLAVLQSAVGAILPDTSVSLPSTIAKEVASQLAKGIQAEIVTRPSAVQTGTTIPVRFRTTTGLSPKMSVYSPANTVLLSNAAMTEVSGIGIYEYQLTVQKAWGLGDFTVVVNESTKNSVDSIILHVIEGSTEGVTASTAATAASSAITLDTLYSRMNKMNGDIDTLMSNVKEVNDNATDVNGDINQLIAKLGGASLKGDASAVGSLVDSVTAAVGSRDDTTYQTILGKLAGIEATLADIGSDAAAAMALNQDAQDQALTVAQLAALVKQELEAGELESAEVRMAKLSETLLALQETIKDLPNGVTADSITTSVEKALGDLSEVAAQKGLDGLIPLIAGGIKRPEGSLTAEEMLQMRNDVNELKSLMLEVRGLLDQEVNKPIIHGWLEGN